MRLGLAAYRGLDRGNVDFAHRHHCVKCALCDLAPFRQGLGQNARRDLPRQAPFIPAPAAGALLAAIADNGIPVAVCLCLVLGRYLKRKCLAVLEPVAAVQANAGDTTYGESDA